MLDSLNYLSSEDYDPINKQYIIFFDIEKAFDTIDHKILSEIIYKLNISQ